VCDVLMVGGGVAGSSLAIMLGRSGFAVHLFMRSMLAIVAMSLVCTKESLAFCMTLWSLRQGENTELAHHEI
jgi:heterodisulfide reductase subunit A-like polyferredoxin